MSATVTSELSASQLLAMGTAKPGSPYSSLGSQSPLRPISPSAMSSASKASRSSKASTRSRRPKKKRSSQSQGEAAKPPFTQELVRCYSLGMALKAAAAAAPPGQGHP